MNFLLETLFSIKYLLWFYDFWLQYGEKKGKTVLFLMFKGKPFAMKAFVVKKTDLDSIPGVALWSWESFLNSLLYSSCQGLALIVFTYTKYKFSFWICTFTNTNFTLFCIMPCLFWRIKKQFPLFRNLHPSTSFFGTTTMIWRLVLLWQKHVLVTDVLWQKFPYEVLHQDSSL